MIEFPPEFYGLVSALWSTYQYAIWIWFALMFAAIVLLGFLSVIWNVYRAFRVR